MRLLSLMEDGFKSDGDYFFDVRVKSILQYTLPWATWGIDPQILKREIRKAGRENQMIPHSWHTYADDSDEEHGLRYIHPDEKQWISEPELHARRIVWLVRHPDSNPIHIDVGFDETDFYLEDGNHRLVAAMIRNEPIISTSISGAWDVAVEMGLISQKQYTRAYRLLGDVDEV